MNIAAYLNIPLANRYNNQGIKNTMFVMFYLKLIKQIKSVYRRDL